MPQISEETLKKLFDEIQTFSYPRKGDNKHNCREYAYGFDKSKGYAYIYTTVDGIKIKRGVHQVVAMFNEKITEIPSEVEPSHLCHHPLCVVPSHIILEGQDINKSRKACKTAKKCLKSVSKKLHIPKCLV